MLARLPLIALLAAAAPASAQFGARAEVQRPIAAGSDVDPTSSASTVELDDRPRALETTDEVLLEVPGARRRRSGGFGGFTALSLRGAEAEHTVVLIGDVPITTADGTAFDLSTVPPWLFDRVEVYRGGAPVWLGAGAIGGVLRLVPRTARGRRAEAVGGGGSFDLAQGRLASSVEGRDASFAAVAGLTHSGGAFPVRRERVPGEPDATQANAWLLEAAGLAHGRAGALGGTLSAVALGLGRTGGIPPPVDRYSPDASARRTHTRIALALAGEWLEGGRVPEQADLASWRAQIVVAAGFDRRRRTDLEAETGLLPQDRDDRLARIAVRGAATFRLADWIDASIVAVGWHEMLEPHDALAVRAPEPSRRDGGSVAVESRLHARHGPSRWELRPSARLEVVDAALAEIRPEEVGARTATLHAMPTARLGAVLEIVPGIAVQASGATATRAPSSVELFGDGGLVLGSTRLVPETSRTIDGGIVLRGAIGELRGFAELRGFGLWISNLVRYRRNAYFQVVPENVASAWIAGLEGSARAELERWGSFVGAITWLETRDESQVRPRELPYRPRLAFYARPAVHVEGPAPFDRASIYADVEYTSGLFDDPANTSAIPELVRVGAGIGVEIFDRGARLDVALRDLFDARGRDFAGRPLPGRSLAVQLALRMQ